MDQHQKAVKAYMSEIGNYGLVTPLQEVELANLIAEGSDAAREMLTHGNLRLVVKIANEYRHLGVPMSDLIAEGNVGLMRAVLKFRGGHGAKFSSYAAWWIKQAIRRCVANQGRIVRVPIQSLSRYRQIREVAASIESKTGRVANNHEIAAEMKVTPLVPCEPPSSTSTPRPHPLTPKSSTAKAAASATSSPIPRRRTRKKCSNGPTPYNCSARSWMKSSTNAKSPS